MLECLWKKPVKAEVVSLLLANDKFTLQFQKRSSCLNFNPPTLRTFGEMFTVHKPASASCSQLPTLPPLWNADLYHVKTCRQTNRNSKRPVGIKHADKGEAAEEFSNAATFMRCCLLPNDGHLHLNGPPA